MKPKTIFKYMPTYANNFFDHLLLRATPRNELNDPFEFVPTKGIFDWQNSILQEKGFQKYTYSDCCKGWFPTSGVISFSKTKSNLLMWSHYAEDHKGMVVEFDVTDPFFSNLRKVCYDKVKPKVISKLEDLFFIKSDEWIYEEEYRLIMDLLKHDKVMDRETNEIKSNNPNVNYSYGKCPILYMFSVPPQSIISVTFGCNVSKEFKYKIIQSISSNKLFSNINIYDVSLSDTHFNLEFDKFNI